MTTRLLLAASLLLLASAACSSTPPPAPAPDAPLARVVDVAQLQQYRTPYVGDASAVINLTNATHVEALGRRTLAIHAERRPYTMEIDFSSLAPDLDAPRAAQLLRPRAVLLLATVTNLDEVTWQLPDGSRGRLTRGQADALAGAPTRSSFADQESLHNLVEHLAS